MGRGAGGGAGRGRGLRCSPPGFLPISPLDVPLRARKARAVSFVFGNGSFVLSDKSEHRGPSGCRARRASLSPEGYL